MSGGLRAVLFGLGKVLHGLGKVLDGLRKVLDGPRKVLVGLRTTASLCPCPSVLHVLPAVPDLETQEQPGGPG